MEVARTRFAVASVSIAAGVVQHPTNDPIISTSNRSVVIPKPRIRACIPPYGLNCRTEGCVGVLVGGVRGTRIRVGWFELLTPALQLLVESVDGFLLEISSVPMPAATVASHRLPSFASILLGGQDCGHPNLDVIATSPWRRS